MASWRTATAALFGGVAAGLALGLLATDDQKSGVAKLLALKQGVARSAVFRARHPPVTAAPSSPPAAAGPRFDHSRWTAVLRRYVVPGTINGCATHVVRYGPELEADTDFRAYLDQLAAASDPASWADSDEALAFYLNAYNALCMGHVVRYRREHPAADGGAPLEKLTDIPARERSGASSSIWTLPAGVVAGKTLSLDTLENGIIRAGWDEPRCHAALNCASCHCPNLRREAFEASRLDEQLDEQAREWLSNPQKGVSVVTAPTPPPPSEGAKGAPLRLRATPIFDWYAKDFGSDGSPLGFIRKHR